MPLFDPLEKEGLGPGPFPEPHIHGLSIVGAGRFRRRSPKPPDRRCRSTVPEHPEFSLSAAVRCFFEPQAERR